MADKGFIWFATNTDSVDYIDLSRKLAESIKKHNSINKVCVITDKKIQHDKYFDYVVTMKNPSHLAFNNEHRIFGLSPFTHSIKLEADMVVCGNIDWWWNYLCRHDMVTSRNCLNYKGEEVVDKHYRELFRRNSLPNIYNCLTYFRKSKMAENFYKLCGAITKNWNTIREECLVGCDNDSPTTDEVYALAYKMLDPLDEHHVEFDWFKIVHNKNLINGIRHSIDNNEYLNPVLINNDLYVGSHRLCGIWHYHHKKTMEQLNARIF